MGNIPDTGTKTKILFVGNSITWHSPAPDIGWFGDWGMAASAPEKDYVHLVMRKATEKVPEAQWMRINIADYERSFWDYDLEKLADARNFNADIIVIRITENVNKEMRAQKNFCASYSKMIAFLNAGAHASVLCTGSFWPDAEGDKMIREVCARDGYRYIDMSCLWPDDSNKALGLFAHEGVAGHPSDRGMEYIAGLIWKELDCLL